MTGPEAPWEHVLHGPGTRTRPAAYAGAPAPCAGAAAATAARHLRDDGVPPGVRPTQMPWSQAVAWTVLLVLTGLLASGALPPALPTSR